MEQLMGAVMDRMDAAPEIVTALMNDVEFREQLVRAMLQQLFGEVRSGKR